MGHVMDVLRYLNGYKIFSITMPSLYVTRHMWRIRMWNACMPSNAIHGCNIQCNSNRVMLMS
eukprot:scaffold106753_cov50-Attheya_sp.AAC.1